MKLQPKSKQSLLKILCNSVRHIGSFCAAALTVVGCVGNRAIETKNNSDTIDSADVVTHYKREKELDSLNRDPMDFHYTIIDGVIQPEYDENGVPYHVVKSFMDTFEDNHDKEATKRNTKSKSK